MKKIQVSALAVMALTVLLSGCQENELRNDTYIPQEGEIVFKVTNNPKLTKSSEDISCQGCYHSHEDFGWEYFLSRRDRDKSR